MKSFRDGTLKWAILNYILNHPECTSQDIANHVQHSSIKTLRSEIYYLRRYGGFISADKSSIPHRLTLSKSGKNETQQGPYSVQIKRQKRQERILAMVSAILNDDEKFAEAVNDEVEKEVKQRMKEIESGVREAPTIVETIESKTDTELRKEIESKDMRIHELQAQIQHLRLHKANVPTRAPPVQKSPEEQKADAERRQRREQLSMRYRGMLLDAPFFHHWKDMFPFRMKHLQLYKEGSVEIMSPSNPEHRRGHARRPLNPAEVIGGKYHIVKMTKQGIVIEGMGLPGGQASLRW
ncbi:hypothetical protein MettiDRAFT_2355 [Methanolobus tindarius DSM 2278]|uniref:Uncharacterized protein n=1 Tax=Methanolobus tindarius DSM 2278 TaxID=1090322 RepID=W9DST9_METTI|nr:hypothetical protein [Methanolobus tindarius]ETA68868.1 hypothetical protein MettiDRAFT_2355 [Methanolobus tindarius DSM 2278]